MASVRTKVTQGGRIVIPAEFRRALGIRTGDEVILSVEGEELRVLTPEHAIKRAQALVRRYVPEGRLLTEELIAERRAEARSE